MHRTSVGPIRFDCGDIIGDGIPARKTRTCQEGRRRRFSRHVAIETGSREWSTDVPKELILLLGGARSGKSRLALRLAAQRGGVLFVATAEARDDEMRTRIAAHRMERPATWTTLEEPLDLAAALAHLAPSVTTVVLDCLTLWVSNRLLLQDNPAADATILAEAERLLDRYASGTATWIVVSNEVGLGLVPDTELGRRYRDILGEVNQRFAQRAERVLLMVAGLPVDLKRLQAGE